MNKLKSTIITAILSTSIVTANSYCVIEGWQCIGSTRKDHAVINNAVIAVNALKRQKADRYIDNEQYAIRINRLLSTLTKKGIRVRQ